MLTKTKPATPKDNSKKGPHDKAAVSSETVPAGAEAPAGWGSDYLAKLLRHIGLEYVALNPGSSYRGLHDSLVNHLGDRSPQMLTVLHEEHAVAIAHGFAKVTGRPMGAILHANVGLMHGSMGIFDAWCDRVPVLIYGANGPMDTVRRRPWIDWLHSTKDQASFIRSFIKWDAEPVSLEAARDAVLRARQIATTAPQGPTYVCFDSGLQEALMKDEPALPPLARYAAPRRPGLSAATAREVAELLYGAKRPVMMIGRASRREDDWANRVALAEHLGAKVLTDLKNGAAFPTWHPLHAAPATTFLNDDSVAALKDADLVLSLDWIDLAGTLRAAWGAELPAHVVHVSLDATLHNGMGGEHQEVVAADTHLLCDPDEFCQQVLEQIRQVGKARSKPSPRPSIKPGSKLSAPADPAASKRQVASATAAGGDMSLEAFTRVVSAFLTDEAPACLIRVNLGWPGGGHPLGHPLDYLGGDGGGGVGAGPGISVGAALGLRGSDRLPVAILGDGDFLMGCTAIWTAVKYKIPLLVIIADNRSFFNDEVHQERVAIMRSRPVENKWVGQRIEGPEVDLPGMARAQGATAWGPVKSLAELPGVLNEAAQAVRAGQVAVVDVRVAREYAKAMSRGLTRGH
ncbi:MAG: thiamine pyrophosphate-binding protein [Variovorax sp.]